MDKDLFQKRLSRNEKNYEFETPINKTINNNILTIKVIFLILLLQKYK